MDDLIDDLINDQLIINAISCRDEEWKQSLIAGLSYIINLNTDRETIIRELNKIIEDCHQTSYST